MASNQKDEKAIPLVLPNNCTWNEQTGECETNTNIKRKTLDVQQRALDQLKGIKGNVCVVSIAGFCRQGKSYVLSRAFDQEGVFPLGNKHNPETIGIWLWVVPQKFQDSNGREFTVVLLDSEGIDAVSGEETNDHAIFTLTVLLSSIMIYNSVGVATRSVLEDLDFIVQLSKRIYLHTNTTEQDDKHFFEVFPYFILLMRDVRLDLPRGCNTNKEYLMKKVLNGKAEGNEQSKKAAESILTYFSGFDAFSLPPPAFNPQDFKNIDDEIVKSHENPQFLEQIEEFQTFLHSKLSPKKSINVGEFVTGEALAALVHLYVEALNTPGTVPNVQNAWDTFVHNKCREVLAVVLEKYEQEMTSDVVIMNKILCDTDVIRVAGDGVVERCRKEFLKRTSSLSIKSVDHYLKKLTDDIEADLKRKIQSKEKEMQDFKVKYFEMIADREIPAKDIENHQTIQDQLKIKIKLLEEEVKQLKCRLTQMETNLNNAKTEITSLKARESKYATLQGDKNILILGEMCRKLQENVYRYVFPDKIPIHSAVSYKIDKLENEIDKRKTLTTQEKQEARIRFGEVKVILNLDSDKQDLIRKIQKLRNDKAHSTEELNQAISVGHEAAVEELSKGTLFVALDSSEDEIKELIKIWQVTVKIVTKAETNK